MIKETIKIHSITALFPLSSFLVKLQTLCIIGQGERANVNVFSLLIISTELNIIAILLKKKNHSTNRKETRLHELHLPYYPDESCLVKFPGENSSPKDAEYDRVDLAVLTANDAAFCRGSHFNLHRQCFSLLLLFVYCLVKTVALKSIYL